MNARMYVGAVSFHAGSVADLVVSEGYGHVLLAFGGLKVGERSIGDLQLRLGRFRGHTQIVLDNPRGGASRKRRPLTIWISGPDRKVNSARRLFRRLPAGLSEAALELLDRAPDVFEALEWKASLPAWMSRMEWRPVAAELPQFAASVRDATEARA